MRIMARGTFDLKTITGIIKSDLALISPTIRVAVIKRQSAIRRICCLEVKACGVWHLHTHGMIISQITGLRTDLGKIIANVEIGKLRPTINYLAINTVTANTIL